MRLNSGGGIAIGGGGHVLGCNVHDNGQIGITGVGDDVRIEQNAVWHNNTHGFNYRWEAGGIKITESTNVIFHANHVYNNLGPGIWCDINCQDILFDDNLIEDNQGAGIVYEISFGATIRGNWVRTNGVSDDSWFGGVNILVAGAEGVRISDNHITVQPDGCGVLLVDQNWPGEGSRRKSRYMTRNNIVEDNQISFTGSGCMGGLSDAKPGEDNYFIITKGYRRFDHDTYRFLSPHGRLNFPWGHAILDWNGVHAAGLELNGKLVDR